MASQTCVDTSKGSLTVIDYRNRLVEWPGNDIMLKTLEYIYGLEDEIINRHILSEEQIEVIHSLMGRRHEQNRALLKIICQGSELKPYEDFMNCLAITFQEHLKIYIRKNGHFLEEDGNRPLMENERRKLRSMRRMLVEVIFGSIRELVDYLQQEKCISPMHSCQVLQEKAYDKARLLLEIVECRSFDHYKCFFASLRIVNRMFDPITIYGDGVCTAVDSQQASTSQASTSLMDEQIVQAFKQMPPDTFQKILDQYKEFMMGSRVELLAASCSIRTYIYCSSMQSLRAVRRSVEDGQMKEFLQLLFNALLGGSASVVVRYVFMVDYSMQEFYLQCANNSVNYTDKKCEHKMLRNGGDNMKKVFCRGSLCKAKERILLYSHLWRVSTGRKYSSRPIVDAMTHLSSVCQDWFNAIKREKFERHLRQELQKHDTSVKLTLISNMIFDYSISCLTHLFNDICIVTRDRPNVIQVIKQFSPYPDDRVSFSVGDRLRISYMEASEQEDGIFCIDETDGSVWFWSRGHTEGPATSMKQFSPCTYLVVSPLDQQRILLNANSGIIEIHDQPSEFIQFLRLPNHVEKPLSMVVISVMHKEKEKGYLLVSHGYDNQHRICMMSLQGSVVLTYGGKRGEGPNQLNYPCSLTLDNENDRLFVADKENHRVLALDNKLRLVNVVLDKKHDYLESPTLVHYAKYQVPVSIPGGKDEEILQVRRLIVASDKSVSIYGFQK